MKRFLLWIIGVILGVVVLLGAVMAVSYSFTGEGSRPEAAAQFIQFLLIHGVPPVCVGRERNCIVPR